MLVQKNVLLAEKTTMKIGGYTNSLFIPESEEELIQTVQEIYNREHHVYILSGGSNLLINDNKHFDEIVYMKFACSEMTNLGDGRFYIGASNRIQKVISYVNDFGYGGFEGLIGLPTMFGGIIYMNAGLGGATNPLFTISDFIVNVRAWDMQEKKLVELDVSQCEFSHRKSIFHANQYVILGATIHLEKLPPEEVAKAKEERLKFCKDNFEYGKGCFGTCFSGATYKILKLVSIMDQILRLGRGRITFGKHNKNWLVNQGNGKFEDAIRIINMCKLAHRMCLRKIECEVIIWE